MDNQIKTSEAITIRYITEDAQRLRAEAKAAGCSLSELIRERSLRADMEAELLKIRIQKISAQLCRHNLRKTSMPTCLRRSERKKQRLSHPNHNT